MAYNENGDGGRPGRGGFEHGPPEFADQEQPNHGDDYGLRKDLQHLEPLLPGGAPGAEPKSGKDSKEENKGGCWYKLQRCMGWTAQKERRRINFDGTTRPRRFPSNKLNNQKYSLITFLPLLLYNEFKFFFNAFFLGTALTQFVPVLKVGLLVTYVAPLGIVLLITCFKEAYDDLQRRRRDQELNNYIYYRAGRENEKGKRNRDGLLQVKAKDIKVGQIIRVNHNERLPADMVLLYTTEKSGSIFLRTDQLDGETDWKPRKALGWTQRSASPLDVLVSGSFIEAEPPSEEIYDFKANCQQPGGAYKKDSLGPENTMWQNTVLASHGFVYGMVLYTGRETRSNMSAKKPRSKVGSIDLQINFLTKILFGLMMVLAFIIIAMDGFPAGFWLKFFRCVLLLCAIIPISMRINMDFAKLYYAYKISTDDNIEDAVARNSTIPEELGRIQVLLSDKTGTLTKNEMLFKRLTLEYCSFSEENIKDISKLLRKGMRQLNRDRQKEKEEKNKNIQPSINAEDGNYTSANEANYLSAAEANFIHESAGQTHSSNAKVATAATDGRKGLPKRQPRTKKRGRKRGQHRVVADLFLALSLCHNVTPVGSEEPDDSEEEQEPAPQAELQQPNQIEEKSKKEKRVFQASSPDDIALVEFAESMGMRLEYRDELYVEIKDINGKPMKYEILENFPFSSETKRMGVIVQNQSDNKITFYLKGAEVVMERKVRPDQRVSLTEACEQLAQDGLRTLVICQKSMSNEEYQNFRAKYQEARASLDDREKQTQEALGTIEEGMEFLAVTGVEDKLQENVLETIEKFRAAGIQVWMLTGDKIETAKCIAIATGMNRKTESVHEIKGDQLRGDEPQLSDLITEYEKVNKNTTMLMVDGVALGKIMASEHLTGRFFSAASGAKSVCVCRCSPTQKAFVAKSVKNLNKKRIACVGDGGNDVAMIQEADVGLGIVGKEGKQAALASDFSINQFSHLRDLILWHGRLSYQRTAKLSQFIIHRGMIISFIQAFFTMIFFSVTIPIFNGFLVLGYATMYTSMPVFSLVLDEDADRATTVQFPILYQALQAGRSLNVKTFLIWVWKSIYQACIIMFLAVILFNDSFVTITSISFTTLILIEFLNVIQEVTHIRRETVITIFLSTLIYLSSIYFFNTLFQVKLFMDQWFFPKVALIAAASWLPLWIFKKIVDWYDPSAVQKVRKTVK